MATILMVHGSWSGGWAYQRLKAPLSALGHDFRTPTMIGVGDRFHLAHKDIDVDAHVRDIVAVLEFEDLSDVVLIGHSYGGMVATGVADRATDRLRSVIYLDAFVPKSGDSVLGFHTPENREIFLSGARDKGNGWGVPPGPLAPDVEPDDAPWISARRRPQPVKTYQQQIALTGRNEMLPRAYIYCTKKAPGDVFRQFSDRLRDDPAWRYVEIDAGHTPNLTRPVELAAIIDRIVMER